MPKFDVTFAGEINLDLIFYGLPPKLPTERELLAKSSLLTLGSSSAICAHNLATMGASIGFITRAARDPLGELALNRLREAAVDLRRVTYSAQSTTGMTVVLPHRRARHILTYPGTMFEMSYKDLNLDYLTSARHFHMSSFFLHRALRKDIPRLFHAMKKAGLTTSLDTNDDPDDRWASSLCETLKHVDILFPNQKEACKIARKHDVRSAIRSLANVVPLVVVKLGARGAIAFANSKEISGRGVKARAIDPVGAGDSFDAGFLYQFLRGAPLAKCLEWGNLAGAFSTTRAGGTEAFRNRDNWQAFLRKHRAT